MLIIHTSLLACLGQTDRHPGGRRCCLCPHGSINGHWLQRPWTSPVMVVVCHVGGQLRAICLHVTAVTPSAEWVTLTGLYGEDNTQGLFGSFLFKTDLPFFCCCCCLIWTHVLIFETEICGVHESIRLVSGVTREPFTSWDSWRNDI